MTTKKANTRNRRTSEAGKSHAEKPRKDLDNLRALAQSIAGVLNNPRCPTFIYNSLVDSLGDLYMPASLMDSPEYIETLLKHYYVYEKGGAR